MSLPVVPLDSPHERLHRTAIATSLNELIKFYNTIKPDVSWTPVVRGSGTAGTYELATASGRVTRIGRRVIADFSIMFAGAVTGGGTGYLQITGLPYTKADGTVATGSVFTVGVDFANAGASLSLTFIATTATAVLQIRESVDNTAGADLPISGVAANDLIRGSICFETDDP